jgi:transposase-like protein
MAMSTLNAPHFQDPEKAREFLEKLRWNGEPVCPHCGTLDAYKAKRAGVYRCSDKDCRKDFTVTTKSVMESSHIPLHIWLQAFHYMSASKKGHSAHQLHRTLGITYKSAWFLAHRIREAMRTGGLAPMGGPGKVVEIDETVIGRVEGAPKKPKQGTHTSWRNVVLTLVERGGSVRSFHVGDATMASLLPIIRVNINRESSLMTDEWTAYKKIGEEYASHEWVTHSRNEYVRGNVSTNTVEGYYSIFKRGMKGVYQHCKEKHLHRYLAEFDFRYSYRVRLGYSDEQRAALAIKGAAGKRLTYRQPRREASLFEIPF